MRGRFHSSSILALVAAVGLSGPALAQSQQNQPTNLDEIIVTGVRGEAALADAAVAVSVLGREELDRVAPVSAADLLKVVPGVYVNSALGEIRNVVYSRGVSANSVEAASGYYYVSLQEDGLPVTNVTFTNFGPDYFLRPDITLGRVEALRGGTATVTGPNAPGGIFNYISRGAGGGEARELRLRTGLEGDGENPFYRADALIAGQIGDTDLSYSLGGFYRRSRGARDAGYDLNRGGQIKANLTWDYGSGTLEVFGKYLNDRNGFFEFLPARNFNDPQVVSELGAGASFLPPSASYSFTPYAGAAPREWDAERLAHSRASAFGVRLNHDFNNGWTLSNNFRVSRNEIEWNSGGVIFPISITDPVLNLFMGTTGPGLYTYRDRATGAILAQVDRVGATATVVTNNLPNQSILTNGVLSQASLYYEPTVDEVMNQFSVTRSFDRGSVTAGAFYARSDVHAVNQGAGIGASPIADRPQLFDITRTVGGVVQQVTNSAGLASVGNRLGATVNDTTQTQVSLFVGGDFDVTDRLTLDVGLRYEDIQVEGFNQISATNPANPVGGLDGNVNTLFDNTLQALSTPFAYDRSLDFVSYSAAASWEWNDEQTTYVRVSDGSKAPDLAFYAGLDTAAELTGSPSIAQEVFQIELGHRIETDRMTLVINPFYSELTNVGSVQLFTRADGTTYSNPPLFATQETLGIEIESRFQVTDRFSLQFQGTFQDPKSKDFALYVANAPGEADDTISRVPDGDADNSAKVTTNVVAVYDHDDVWNVSASWRYLGDRAANRFNTFDLPGFHQVDLSAAWNLNERVRLSANVNNVFNSEGVMSWGPAGGLLASLDRQAFTPAQRAANPNQFFNIITVQPRAFYVSVDLSF